jgi:hypothetical protein
MVGSSTARSLGRPGAVPPSLQVVNWPLRDDGIRGWLMIALLAGVAAAAGEVAHSVPMGSVVFVALATAAWRLWIPVRFEFNAKGITETVFGRRRRMPWTDFARYEVRRGGVLLLADSQPSVLAPFRGLFIRWRDQRDKLLETLDFFLNPRLHSPGSSVNPP